MSYFFIPGEPVGPIVGLFMLFIYLVILLVIIVAVYNFLDEKRGYDRRITALEERVDELESEQS